MHEIQHVRDYNSGYYTKIYQNYKNHPQHEQIVDHLMEMRGYMMGIIMGDSRQELGFINNKRLLYRIFGL